MYQLTEHEESLCKEVVDCAFRVHKELGPGLLEKVYEACFCHELEEIVICEIKAVDTVNPLWQAQIMSHLKLTGNNIGFLINFNVSLIKNGIRRYCVE